MVHVGKKKKAPIKNNVENMLVVFPVHFQNTIFKLSCETRALLNQIPQSPNSHWRADFLAQRVCHAESEERGKHSGSEIELSVSAEEAEKGIRG